MTDAPYLDPERSAKERAVDLVSRMTLEEKISQMCHDAPAVERLGVPAYNWWNECLHGVARAGVATVFPQAIGLAATWDVDLMQRIATAISDEARAKHHAALSADGSSAWYCGLTFWSPNINIFRDPRWGRGQETYGECPYLTARMAVAFCRGLQGDDSRYLKVVATPKHFAVHSGPEASRHGFNATVSPRDLRETYLPAFKACVQEANVASVMSAYNRVNGEACSASPTLLGKILREEWGFDGYVVSDCGAVGDIHAQHHLVDTPAEAAALAVNHGCDLNCGCTYQALTEAVGQGLIEEETLDRSLVRLFEARFRLGMFDPPEQVPFAQIPLSVNDCEAHRELARQAARESLVLLKNDEDLLPLSPWVVSVAVVGPNADDETTLLGNYNGTPSRSVTPLAGLRAWAKERSVDLHYAKGCPLVGDSREGFAEAAAAVRKAQVVIAVMGLSPLLEGEEGEANLLDNSGDRASLELPAIQQEFLKEIHAVGKPLVLVVSTGSPLALNWAKENAAAIVVNWYGGEEAGAALAEMLTGLSNPSGRLPVTFYKSLDQVPPFEEYGMAGRTYRFLDDEPLFPFGYGQSYTRFDYSALRITPAEPGVDEPVTIEATVRNTGDLGGAEVVQLYTSALEAPAPAPRIQLQGFRRVFLKPGQTATVSFTLPPEQQLCWSEDGEPLPTTGRFRVSVGGGQPMPAFTQSFVEGEFRVTPG